MGSMIYRPIPINVHVEVIVINYYSLSPFPPPNLGFDYRVQTYTYQIRCTHGIIFSLRSHLGRCIYKPQGRKRLITEVEGLRA